MRVAPKFRPVALRPSLAARLNSWKEIAAYLGRDPRTVQLWEKHEGLPVHRLNHQARASVYGYIAEIDAWLKTRSARAAHSPGAEIAAASAESSRRAYLISASVAIVVLIAVAGWWAWRHRPLPQGSNRSSIVVFPFDHQTSSDDLLTDTLISEIDSGLGRAGGVRVISPTSAEEFKGLHFSDEEIQSRLHASYALRGTVAEASGQATVTVELLDAARDSHLWGATYTWSAADIRSGHDRIASTIVAAVIRKVTYTSPRAVAHVDLPESPLSAPK